MASRGVALLTKANALKLDGKRLVKPLEEDVLCLDEWIAARGDDNSRFVSELVRVFVARSSNRPATIANDPADPEERLLNYSRQPWLTQNMPRSYSHRSSTHLPLNG